jgi:RES domain-containing protein
MKLLPEWKHYRAIHSRFPPTNLFDSVGDADQALLAELESATSDRIHRWREFVAPEDARFGHGWGAVMASFCYVTAGRFNTPHFGAYYCADSPHTAIAEWSYHAAKTWRDFGFTEEASATVRTYSGKFAKELVDLRTDAAAHHSNDYRHSQGIAFTLWQQREFGVLYRSVRREGNLAAALFRPPATSAVMQAAHYSVRWNGTNFIEFARLSEYEKI